MGDRPIWDTVLWGLRAFIKATALGALAGASPGLILTPRLALMSLSENSDVATKAGVFFFDLFSPLLVSFPIVFVSSVCLGLPVTALLHTLRRESASTYMLAGAVAGFLVIVLFMVVEKSEGGYILALFGLISGGVTGRTWWAAIQRPPPPAETIKDATCSLR